MAGEPRRQLHGYVSNEARDGWYRFAAEHDANVTSLLEAIGLKLSQLVGNPASRLPAVFAEVTRDAQRIAGKRSTRWRQDAADEP